MTVTVTVTYPAPVPRSAAGGEQRAQELIKPCPDWRLSRRAVSASGVGGFAINCSALCCTVRARTLCTLTHTRPTVQGHCDLHCVTLCLAVLFNHFSLLCSRSNRVIAQHTGCTCCQVHVQHMVWPGQAWPGGLAARAA